MKEVASTGDRVSLDDLHQGIPLLSAAVTVIQRSIISYNTTKDDKSRAPIKVMQKLCKCVQDHLSGVDYDTGGEVDAILVGCLSKCATVMIAYQKAVDQDSSDASMSEETPSDAMEIDDITERKGKKKLKKMVVKDKANTDSKLWQDVLDPILSYVLRHMERTEQLDSATNHDADERKLDTRTSHSLEDCLDYMSAVCEFGGSHRELVDEDTIDKIWKQLLITMSIVDGGHVKGR